MPYETWIHNEQYCAGLTLLAIGCQLTPQEIVDAKVNQTSRNRILVFLSDRFSPKSRQIVEELLQGTYPVSATPFLATSADVDEMTRSFKVFTPNGFMHL
jgi:hypothetical protein